MGNASVRELTVAELIALLTTIFTLVGILTAVFRYLVPLFKRLSNLTDDWHGEEARPGVPERKGVMERLGDQDAMLRELNLRLLGHGDGDAPIPAQLSSIERRVDGNAQRIKVVESTLRHHLRESEMWVAEVITKAAAGGYEVPPWPHLRDDDKD